MTENGSITNLINECISCIDLTTPKIETIKLIGQEEAIRGIEKVREADQHLINMNYLKRILTSLQGKIIFYDPIISGSIVDLKDQLFNFYEDIGNIFNGFVNSETEMNRYHSRFIGSDGSTDSTAGTIVYLGANIEMRLQTNSPEYKPVILDEEPDILPSRSVVLSELIDLLSSINEKFVAMVEGSEASLFSDEKDSLSQAAHSMRDCFEQVIKVLAPTNVVKVQPWFEPTPEAPGDVSRRSRLRYILYRSGEDYDQLEVDRFDGLANLAKKSLDICVGAAHNHELNLSQSFTRNVIDNARYNLKRILELYRKRNN